MRLKSLKYTGWRAGGRDYSSYTGMWRAIPGADRRTIEHLATPHEALSPRRQRRRTMWTMVSPACRRGTRRLWNSIASATRRSRTSNAVGHDMTAATDCAQNVIKTRGQQPNGPTRTGKQVGHKCKKPALSQAFQRCSGRGEWIRTTDPSVPNRRGMGRITKGMPRIRSRVRPA